MVDFLPETRKQKEDIFSNAERKNNESRVIYLVKTYFRNKEDINTLLDEGRLRENSDALVNFVVLRALGDL